MDIVNVDMMVGWQVQTLYFFNLIHQRIGLFLRNDNGHASFNSGGHHTYYSLIVSINLIV